MKFFDNLFNIKKEKYIYGLNNALQSIYVYELYLKEKKSIVCVLNTIYEANQLFQNIQSYTDDVVFFPMDDFLTSEALAISPELKTTRLETINQLLYKNKIIVTNLMGYLRYLPPKEDYINSVINIKVGEEYNIKNLTEKLYNIGYTRDIIVNKTGNIAIRGFILDIFPIGENNPIRIEFFGDVIEEIRIFDIDSQLTIKKIKNISIYPNTEFITGQYIENKTQKDLIKYTNVVNINDYLDDCITIFHNYNEIELSYNNLQKDILEYNGKQDSDVKQKYMHDFQDIKINDQRFIYNYDNSKNSNDSVDYKCHDLQPFTSSIDDINQILNNYLKSKKTIIICVADKYKVNKIIDNFNNKNIVITNESEIINNKINLIIKNIQKGFIFNDYVIISEKELFNKKTGKTEYKSKFRYGTKIKNINKLNIGDYIVHNAHGIGRYLGIKTLTKNNLKKDYLTLEYKGGDKLYIPVEKIDYITKYSSDDNIKPKINKLGGTEWQKTKLRVKQKIENMALDLLNLYAKRENTVGFSFNKDDENQIAFEKDFIYEDTVDQRKVTEEIKRDMEKNRPMDRLLCGDVGYGKTEIAFRAMFKAVSSNKQIAYLCPTTILSTQHYNNALERFKNFPVNIACLNRFVSKKETANILNRLKEGKIDILIGTHRILSDDVIFKDLGLLVIDEEQRFGVKHKEQIKKLKNNIDVLTLSATPIPRTLQMSMVGIRNLSLLETPPINRFPIQTYVLEENNHIIKDAIYKELSRDGQVYILYNKVEDMELKVAEISKLVPDAKIVSANGKMNKDELENVMIKFINKEYDVLICTTIIETGIDIPNVNTLLIIDADHFGLSQLYQIRGRVGRSNKIAYCYLMYKKGKCLSDVAQKRLNVIKEFTELGSGFSIAARDLSIRGAGDILGSEQAGFIDSVGIDLYLKMLNEEINRQKGIIKNDDENQDQPLIDVETTISDEYVEETDLKILIHKRINEIDSFDKLKIIKEEIEDRFGNINDNLLIYMYEEWFEKLAQKFEIKRVRQTNNFIEIILPNNLTEKINGDILFFETNKLGKMFRYKLQFNSLVVTLDIINLDKHFIYYLIEFMKILEKAMKK